MNTTTSAAITEELTDLTPTAAWSRRVRRIGGFMQVAFAALWLVRASLAIGGLAGDALIAVSGAVVIGAYAYSIRVTAGVALWPSGPEARRIERSVTVVTIVELVAAFVLPAVVTVAGRPGWVLPSTLSGPALAITTGIAAGVLLLGTALAGFRDLARIRAARQHLAA